MLTAEGAGYGMWDVGAGTGSALVQPGERRAVRPRPAWLGLAAALAGALLALPWLRAGRAGEMVRAALTLANREPRLDVSAYNLWYLLRGGEVHLFSSAGHPLGLPVSYQTIALSLFVVLANAERQLGVPASVDQT
jgi:hypothetical protein